MYKSFYSMTTNPFGLSPDPKFLFATPPTQEALACLQYGIANRKGFISMTGEVGTGKTMLLRSALDAVRATNVHTCFVFNPRLDTNDFLNFVLSDFGIPCEAKSKSGMLVALNKWLIERFARREICVLVIDEAQNLSSEMLEEIRLLTNLETSEEKLLQIVLSGQPELDARLRLPDLRQLRQRIALRCTTRQLDEQQTGEYIRHRLQIAGREKDLFLPAAISVIHRYSRGIPRVINLICEHALIFGFVDQAAEIHDLIIHDVAHDLDLVNEFDSNRSTASKQPKEQLSVSEEGISITTVERSA